MKIFKLIFILTIATLLLSSCASKVQNEVLDSSKEDVSKLLDKLIQRDKQINKLTQELEDCRNHKK